MRPSSIRLAVVICLGLAIAALYEFRMVPRLKAQTAPGCGASVVARGYSYKVSRTIFSGGMPGFYTLAGVVVADGMGSVTGTDTISENCMVRSGSPDVDLRRFTRGDDPADKMDAALFPVASKIATKSRMGRVNGQLSI